MYQTPIYGLQAPSDGDPVWETAAQLRATVDKIETALATRGVPPADLAALIAAGWFSDTGWMDVPVLAPFAPISTLERPTVRRVGKRVQMSGGFSSNGLAINGSFTGLGTIPEGLRPSPGKSVVGSVGTASGAAVAQAHIRDSGDIWLRTNALLSSYYSFGSFSWLIP